MQVLLEEHELQECIETEVDDVQAVKVEVDDSPDVRQQKANKKEKRVKKDRRCKSLLISRIHDSQLEYVQERQSPKEIWDALSRVFERKSIASRMHLKRQMLSMRFEGGSLRDHFLRFDRLIREYRGTGADMDEFDVVCHLLLTLGPAYSTVVTALETMPEENLSMEFVKCRLLDEETKKKGLDVESGTVSKDTAAFTGSQQTKKVFKCFGCKKEGHKLAECPNKKKKNEREKVKSEKKSKAHVAEQKGVCFVGVCGGNKRDLKRVEWFIDSGCCDHLVNDESLFDSLKPLDNPIEIAVAKDGESITAEYSGTVKLVSNVNGKLIDCSVENVLLVPELRCNLFSVLRVDEAGMKVSYENGKVIIQRGSDTVASGSRVGKLYRLNLFSNKRGADKALLTCGRIPKNLELWHRRFGHLNAKSLAKMIRSDMVVGMSVKNGEPDKSVVICESCVIGKQSRKPFVTREERRSSRVLELVHSDVCGPITPVGLNGMKYFVTFTDDWSHFAMVFLMESKDDVFEYFEQYEALVTAKFGQKISRLRCDNGGEYRSKRFDQFCKKRGIQVEWTVPYTPEQNGVSERLNRTLVEKTRSMLTDSGVDKRFWGQAIQTAAFLSNRSPSNAIASNVTPFELWEGEKPNVSKLRAFGCPVYVHVPKESWKKLDAKAWKGVFLGYACNGYRVWHPEEKRIVHARDVDFVETGGKASTKGESDKPLLDVVMVPLSDDESNASVIDEEVEDASSEASDPASDEEFASFNDGVNEHERSGELEGETAGETDGGDGGSGRPERVRNVPAWHKDYEVEYAAYALNATSYVENLPNSISEARKRSDWPKWEEAINEELYSLRKNQTWTLTKLPEGRTPITNKWVFKIKRGINAKPDRYKARLVARGFSQRYGLDYSETYSPVAKLDTLRAVLALANQERMFVHQMDVRTAFLNGLLTEQIFMDQPEGFETGDLVCRLNKSIYGLKQASRTWNARFDEFVQGRLKFTRSTNDQCLYIRRFGDEVVIIVLYVDDVLVISSSMRAVEAVKSCLSKEFEMTDAGEVQCFLGMNIDRDMKEGVMRISQRQYFEDMLRRFRMDDCKPISTPLECRLKLAKGEEEKRISDPYRELVGCLTYASVTTRPDLAAAVNFLSQFQSCPNSEHWAHLKRVLRYVRGSLDMCLVYRVNEKAPTLEVFTDADWANDVTDRRSISGAVFKVFGCTVGWTTRKQNTVSLSSTEAELNALCNAAWHEMWLVRLLKDIGCNIELPITFHEDNQSTIRIAEESKDFGRLKHVDVKLHFLRDLVKQKKIRWQYLRSEDQVADIMTKGLPAGAFRRHRTGLGLVNCSD